MKYCMRVRKVKTKGALLVLLWNFLVQATVFSPFTLYFYSIYSRDLDSSLVTALLQLTTLILFLPLFGWLADVYFGRYKVMRVGLCLMWTCSTFIAVVMVVEYPTKIHYGLLLPLYFIAYCGFATFLANSIPFGTDQILDGSADEISAFVFWYVGTWCTGGWVGYVLPNVIFIYTNPDATARALFQHFLTMVLLSVALCLDYLCRDCLVVEPKSQNPLKTVTNVLKYAATHKYPSNRSALTYCEESLPSRIDLGKSKYGGPFTTEQVEDVKTFLRITAVTACIGVVHATGTSLSLPIHLSHFHMPDHLSKCSKAVAAAGYNWTLTATLSITIYEFLVYPIYRNRMPSILQRAGLGAATVTLLGLVLLTTDSVGHANAKVPCMFTANETSEVFNGTSAVLDISYLWVDVPGNVLTGLQHALFFTAIIEFICAQSPYSMKGLIIGLMWSLILIFLIVAVLLTEAWSLGWEKPFSSPSCGTVYYLFATLLSVGGLAVYVAVARWYKRRERDEPANQQAIVEDIYDRYVKNRVYSTSSV